MMGRSRSLKPSAIYRNINLVDWKLFRKAKEAFRFSLTFVDTIVKFGFLVGPQSKDVDKSFSVIQKNVKYILI